MVVYDPVSAYLKNSPDLYRGIKHAASKLSRNKISHIKGYQDQTGRTLSNIEKLNIIADKLATEAISEERGGEPEGHDFFWPMRKIDGQTVTRKEGMRLGTAAQSEELNGWQMKKNEYEPQRIQ